ncbi:MAG: hypothetical protein HY921_12890 [Elusimicrobia bacterium]|nr:hypothetical protein [Elusimicrobiota bacterium]
MPGARFPSILNLLLILSSAFIAPATGNPGNTQFNDIGMPRTSVKPTVEPALLLKRFLEKAGQLGHRLPLDPTVCEWTRPSIISWRQERGCVAVSTWNKLPVSTKKLLTKWAKDGKTSGQEFFSMLFRWLFVPHELAHAFQTASRVDPGHAASERQANDAAVAFLMTEPEGPGRLTELESLLQTASKQWPPIPADPQEADSYFNKNYDELTKDPARYGAYQLRYLLDSLARRNSLRFEEALLTVSSSQPRQAPALDKY